VAEQAHARRGRRQEVALRPLDSKCVHRGGVRQRSLVLVSELVRHVGHGHEVGAVQSLRSSAAVSRWRAVPFADDDLDGHRGLVGAGDEVQLVGDRRCRRVPG
jgi:hypothetical protein